MNLHIVEVSNLSELMMTRVVKTLSIYKIGIVVTSRLVSLVMFCEPLKINECLLTKSGLFFSFKVSFHVWVAQLVRVGD